MKEKTKTKTKDAGTEKEETTQKKEKYFEAVGRRKSAIARVRIFTKKSTDLKIVQRTEKTKIFS